LALREYQCSLSRVWPKGLEQGRLRERGGVQQQQTMAALGRLLKTLPEGL
jgi:hypothetical protein